MTPLGRFLCWPSTFLTGIRCDRWIHIWIGSILAMTALRLGWYGALPVIIYAIGKEIWDTLFPYKHTPDMWDSVATMAGGAIPLGLIMLHRAYP